MTHYPSGGRWVSLKNDPEVKSLVNWTHTGRERALKLTVWRGRLVSFGVAHVPGISTCALIATGVVVGAWIDWLLRKLDGSQFASREAVGIRFCNLANTIEDRSRYTPHHANGVALADCLRTRN
jgi:hypothetical protein